MKYATAKPVSFGPNDENYDRRREPNIRSRVYLGHGTVIFGHNPTIYGLSVSRMYDETRSSLYFRTVYLKKMCCDRPKTQTDSQRQNSLKSILTNLINLYFPAQNRKKMASENVVSNGTEHTSHVTKDSIDDEDLELQPTSFSDVDDGEEESDSEDIETKPKAKVSKTKRARIPTVKKTKPKTKKRQRDDMEDETPLDADALPEEENARSKPKRPELNALWVWNDMYNTKEVDGKRVPLDKKDPAYLKRKQFIKDNATEDDPNAALNHEKYLAVEKKFAEYNDVWLLEVAKWEVECPLKATKTAAQRLERRIRTIERKKAAEARESANLAAHAMVSISHNAPLANIENSSMGNKRVKAEDSMFAQLFKLRGELSRAQDEIFIQMVEKIQNQ